VRRLVIAEANLDPIPPSPSGERTSQRIAAQIPIDDKRTRADYVIDTSGSEAETDRQIDEIASKIKSFTPRRTRGARRP